MYIPDQFKETNPERMSALIEGHPFGTLVTAPEGVPFVSHLPLLFERSAGSQGKLLGHMARANPQWEHFSTGSEALVVFQGPHAYVSPSWYSSPGVPTWNYAVVHLRGRPRLIEGESELEALVARLTHVHESHMSSPWEANLAGERRSKLLNMIVGFEIEITDVQGKFKLSQNRPLEDRQRVIEELSRSNNQTDTAVAKLMLEAIHDRRIADMNIRIATTDAEIAACYVVMRELRPHIAEDQFLSRVRRQESTGYRLAFVQEPDGVVAVAGFRTGENLAWGHFLYVDDLVTLPVYRSKGHGSRLLSWLKEYAVSKGCSQLHLDSGIQRREAHRFYEREGMTIAGFHFENLATFAAMRSGIV